MEERRIVPPYTTFYSHYNTNPSFNHYYIPVYIANPNPTIQAMNIPNPTNLSQQLHPNLIQQLNPRQITLHGYGPMIQREQRVRMPHGPYARAAAQSQPMLAPRVSTNPNPNTTESLNANQGLWTWTLDYHKRLVDAVSVFGGIDEARAVSVWEYINDDRVSLYEVSTHMARLRVFLRNPQWLSAGPSVSTSAAAADAATTSAEEELVPPTMPLLQTMENNARRADLFPKPPESDLKDNTDLDLELKLGLLGN